MYRKQVRRRRAVLVVLVVLALVLISATFSQSSGGPLHTVQQGMASVFSPLEEGATRALKPGRDLVNWVSETFNARGENSDLKTDVQKLRAKLAKAESAIGENEQLRKLVGLDQKGVFAGYKPVTTRVIQRPPTAWYSTVGIAAGSNDGVAVNDPVIDGDGLIGRVTDVTPLTAKVTLITDPESAVSARVLPNGPQGVAKPEAGDPSTMLLDFIDKSQAIHEGQMVVTAGWSNGTISSAFPPDIPIGEVRQTTIGQQETYQSIRLAPFSDMLDLDIVQVGTNGPARPGVPK
ncbi:MAG: rod shape-determining protein MreC [Solirubrobacterales bacterium]